MMTTGSSTFYTCLTSLWPCFTVPTDTNISNNKTGGRKHLQSLSRCIQPVHRLMAYQHDFKWDSKLKRTKWSRHLVHVTGWLNVHSVDTFSSLSNADLLHAHAFVQIFLIWSLGNSQVRWLWLAYSKSSGLLSICVTFWPINDMALRSSD